MNFKQIVRSLGANEDLNFLLTNRIPRIQLTLLMGWFSRIRQPWVRDASLALWKVFTDLDLSDAAKDRFDSLHDCFTRSLKPGARSIDRRIDVMCAPSDGIVGQCGQVADTRLFQAKGFPYELADLFGDPLLAEPYRDGCYATLRLTSAMYHRFHSVHDCRVDSVHYLSGDTWNVNPIALKRIERLFCRNERAVISMVLSGTCHRVALVPVAAVLVASIRLAFVDVRLHLRYRGPARIRCDVAATKGQELGWFEHGSTIIVFAPRGFSLCEGIADGTRIRMGQALMRLP